METVCIYHSRDLDGWMSAAIVKKWFINKHPNYDGVDDLNNDSHSITPPDEETTGERLAFLGWDYGNPIPDLSEYDKVIMCDISFPPDVMLSMSEKLTWIDHHSSAIQDNISISTRYADGTAQDVVAGRDIANTYVTGIRDTKYAACELTWKYFFPKETMPEIVRLLGRYDCFGHKGTDEEQTVLEFQYGARQSISNYEDAYRYLTNREDESAVYEIHQAGIVIYKYLVSEAKQTYKKAFPIEIIESTENYNRFKKFLCVNQERFNPINFGIDYHKDGYDGFACFWYNNNKWSFSLYNDNGLVDCSKIAKQFGGGGHKGASGFVVDDITDILHYETC